MTIVDIQMDLEAIDKMNIRARQIEKREARKLLTAERIKPLNDLLAEKSSMWASGKPLVEKHDLFRQIERIAKSEGFKISRPLMHRLVANSLLTENYLKGIKSGEARYNLDGSEGGFCTRAEEQIARRLLDALMRPVDKTQHSNAKVLTRSEKKK